jgi:osmotically-inducible protein OsmY
LMIGALVGVLVLASAGGGGYAYWAGYVGNRQGSVQNDLNAQLGNRGLGNVKVTISQDWVATLTGEVQNQSFKDQAFGLVSTHTALKSIVNDIQIAMLPADLQAKLSVALAEGGFSSAPTAQVDDTLMVTLSGFAADDAEKQRMLAVVQAVPGVKGVQDAIEVAYAEPAYESVEPGTYGADSGASPDGAVYPQQPSPQGGVDRAALERTLNSRLRAQGLNSVTGRFNPNMAVVLSGVVRSEDERYRALTIASGMPGINGVSDTIQIASAQVERPETNQGASIDPAKLEGEINRALRNRDVNGVSAQVGDDLSVVLKGSASAAEKDRAMQLVRQIRGIRGVRDNIFVVE